MINLSYVTPYVILGRPFRSSHLGSDYVVVPVTNEFLPCAYRRIYWCGDGTHDSSSWLESQLRRSHRSRVGQDGDFHIPCAADRNGARLPAPELCLTSIP